MERQQRGEGGQSSFVKVFQADASAGGPIIKDKVFFFGSFRYADREVGLSRTPAQLQADGRPAVLAVRQQRRQQMLLRQVTAQLSANHQVYGFYQRDFNPELAAFPTHSQPFSVTAFGGTGSRPDYRPYGARRPRPGSVRL